MTNPIDTLSSQSTVDDFVKFAERSVDLLMPALAAELFEADVARGIEKCRREWWIDSDNIEDMINQGARHYRDSRDIFPEDFLDWVQDHRRNVLLDSNGNEVSPRAYYVTYSPGIYGIRRWFNDLGLYYQHQNLDQLPDPKELRFSEAYNRLLREPDPRTVRTNLAASFLGGGGLYLLGY